MNFGSNGYTFSRRIPRKRSTVCIWGHPKPGISCEVCKKIAGQKYNAARKVL